MLRTIEFSCAILDSGKGGTGSGKAGEEGFDGVGGWWLKVRAAGRRTEESLAPQGRRMVALYTTRSCQTQSGSRNKLCCLSLNENRRLFKITMMLLGKTY